MVADGAGQFQFLRPDGEPLPAVAPAPRWEGAGEPLGPTVARLAAAGISIGPHTATPEWYGEPLEVTAALDMLWEPQERGTAGRYGERRGSVSATGGTRPGPSSRCGPG